MWTKLLWMLCRASLSSAGAEVIWATAGGGTAAARAAAQARGRRVVRSMGDSQSGWMIAIVVLLAGGEFEDCVAGNYDEEGKGRRDSPHVAAMPFSLDWLALGW